MAAVQKFNDDTREELDNCFPDGGQANWVGVVAALQKQGFTSVCIMNKAYQCVGVTAATFMPQAWNYTSQNEAGEPVTVAINDNQQLANNWAEGTSWYFCNVKYQVILKAADFLVGQGKCGDKKVAVVAQEFKNAWVIVQCYVEEVNNVKPVFTAARQMYSELSKTIDHLKKECDQ